MSSIIGIVFGNSYLLFSITIFLSFKNYIGYIYTNDNEIIQIISTVIPVVCSFFFFDANQGILCGIIGFKINKTL
jgi:Na+-driven multidrug efflux pump